MARKAIEQLPNDASIYFNAANICGKLERYSEAEELFKRAIKTDSTNPTFYTNLGEYEQLQEIFNTEIKSN